MERDDMIVHIAQLQAQMVAITRELQSLESGQERLFSVLHDHMKNEEKTITRIYRVLWVAGGVAIGLQMVSSGPLAEAIRALFEFKGAM